MALKDYDAAVADFKSAFEACDTPADQRTLKTEFENAQRELKKSKQKDYYKELGLDRTQTYSDDEIKKAYRKESLKHHPDKGNFTHNTRRRMLTLDDRRR